MDLFRSDGSQMRRIIGPFLGRRMGVDASTRVWLVAANHHDDGTVAQPFT